MWFKKKKRCSLFCTNLKEIALVGSCKSPQEHKMTWFASYYFCLCLKLLPTRLKGHDRKAAAALGYSYGLVYTPCAPAVRMLVSVCTSCRLIATPTVVPDSQSEWIDGRKRARAHTHISHLRLHAVRYFTRYIKRLKNDKATNNCKISNTVTTTAHRLVKNTGASSWMKEHKCDLIQNKHTSAHNARALRPPGCVCLPSCWHGGDTLTKHTARGQW